MGIRRLLLLAGLVAVTVAIGRRVVPTDRRDGALRVEDASPTLGGWATCSAPSARAYDVTFGWLLGGLHRRMADDLAAAVAGIAEPHVLEVGPGAGRLAVELARRVQNLRLTGVDVDPAMVHRAQVRSRQEGLDGHLAFVTGDVAALPFPAATFDVVTSSFSVHHWSDPVAGFAEIRRVLRPGGRAILYDLPDGWGRFETKSPPLMVVARAGGFVDAAPTPFRWPGSLSFVKRLEVAGPVA